MQSRAHGGTRAASNSRDPSSSPRPRRFAPSPTLSGHLERRTNLSVGTSGQLLAESHSIWRPPPVQQRTAQDEDLLTDWANVFEQRRDQHLSRFHSDITDTTRAVEMLHQLVDPDERDFSLELQHTHDRGPGGVTEKQSAAAAEVRNLQRKLKDTRRENLEMQLAIDHLSKEELARGLEDDLDTTTTPTAGNPSHDRGTLSYYGQLLSGDESFHLTPLDIRSKVQRSEVQSLPALAVSLLDASHQAGKSRRRTTISGTGGELLALSSGSLLELGEAFDAFLAEMSQLTAVAMIDVEAKQRHAFDGSTNSSEENSSLPSLSTALRQRIDHNTHLQACLAAKEGELLRAKRELEKRKEGLRKETGGCLPRIEEEGSMFPFLMLPSDLPERDGRGGQEDGWSRWLEQLQMELRCRGPLDEHERYLEDRILRLEDLVKENIVGTLVTCCSPTPTETTAK